jgi:hypothetical protein
MRVSNMLSTRTANAVSIVRCWISAAAPQTSSREMASTREKEGCAAERMRTMLSSSTDVSIVRVSAMLPGCPRH